MVLKPSIQSIVAQAKLASLILLAVALNRAHRVVNIFLWVEPFNVALIAWLAGTGPVLEPGSVGK